MIKARPKRERDRKEPRTRASPASVVSGPATTPLRTARILGGTPLKAQSNPSAITVRSRARSEPRERSKRTNNQALLGFAGEERLRGEAGWSAYRARLARFVRGSLRSRSRFGWRPGHRFQLRAHDGTEAYLCVYLCLCNRGPRTFSTPSQRARPLTVVARVSVSPSGVYNPEAGCRAKAAPEEFRLPPSGASRHRP